MGEHNRPGQAAVERVTAAAAKVLGSMEAARLYMQTKNFALGGVAPLDPLKLANGEALAMQELQAHRDSGPLEPALPVLTRWERTKCLHAS